MTNELLKRACEAYVREADFWESTYGVNFHNVSDEDAEKYGEIMDDTRKIFYDVGEELSHLGYPVYYYYITGVTDRRWNHYSLDCEIEDEFREQVWGDSESSQFFMDVTTLPMAKKVLARVKKLAGDDFTICSIVEVHGKPRIRGLNNWTSARRLLKELS